MASSSTAPAPSWGVRGLVLGLAAASAFGTVGALCLLEARQRRRRRRREQGRSRRHRGGPPANGKAAAATLARPLWERLTVVLTTSPLARHPSTDLLDEVLGSFRLAQGVADCDLILVCDGYRDTNAEGLPFKESKFRSGIVDADSAAKYEAYKAALRARACSREGDRPAVQVLELPSRHGFGFAVKAALEHVRTPYVMVVQHDRAFVRPCDVPRVLTAMEADPERVKYVGLPTATTVGHQYHVLTKYAIRLAPIEVDDGGLQLLPLIQWYDSTHICQTEHYRNFIFGPDRFVVPGGFIEDKLGQAQLAAIRRDGVQAAHPRFGTFLACGEGLSEPCVAHLDGRDPLNDSTSRYNTQRGEDVQIAVDHAMEAFEDAEDLARSTKSGETVSLGSAAARAAEAARIRAVEALRPQTHGDPERGRANGRAADAAKPGRPFEPRLALAPASKEPWQEYYVDNSQLKANTPGLGFRMSKHVDDRATDDSSVQWGSTVMGVDLGDGWVRVHSGRFLPTHLGGSRVLSVCDGLHRDSAVSPPHQSQHSSSSGSRVRQDGVGRGGTVRAPPLGRQMMPGPLMPAMPGWGPPVGPLPFGLPHAPRMMPPMGSWGTSSGTSHASSAARAKPKAVGPQPKAKVPSPSPAGPQEPVKGSNSPRSGDRIWEYIDPKGRVQGPFRQAEMLHWHSKGYFPKELPIRCHPEDDFVPFEKLYPGTQTPFRAAPKRLSGTPG